MRYLVLTIASGILCVLGAGCIFSPHKGTGGPPPPAVYVPPISPEAVLQNLALAYQHRDTAEYDTLFDKDYIGTTTDRSIPDTVQTYTFHKADEVAHIWGLSRATTITNVHLELMPFPLLRYTDGGDLPGWAVIQNPIFSLYIVDGQSTFDIKRDNETIEFHFKPKTPDSSSPTDTTWTIGTWTEVRN
jgi:hypothetical protein